MKINKIDHVGIRVTDFARAKAFYGKLGFKTIRENLKERERVVEISHPSGITINLLDNAINSDDTSNVLMDVEKKYPGYTHYALSINSIEEGIKFFQASGITVTEGPVTFGNGKTSLFVRDPDSNVIEFTQNPQPKK